MEKGQLNAIKDINEYVLDNSLRESDVLTRLRMETEKDSHSIMQIPPEQGQFMALLVKLIDAKRTIEIVFLRGIARCAFLRRCPTTVIPSLVM